MSRKSSISAASASLGAELLHRRREQLAAALRQSFDRPLQSIAQSPAPKCPHLGLGCHKVSPAAQCAHGKQRR
jgi:hypothetical protein